MRKNVAGIRWISSVLESAVPEFRHLGWRRKQEHGYSIAWVYVGGVPKSIQPLTYVIQFQRCFILKRIYRLLFAFSCTTLLLATAQNAKASSINGNFAMIGSDSFTTSAINFDNPGTVFGGSGANTGTFSVLSDLTPVTMFPALNNGSFAYSTGHNVLVASPVEAFTMTSAGGTNFQFWMTDYDAAYIVNGMGCTNATCLDITGHGYFTGTGYANAPGSFAFTTQDTFGQTSTTYSLSAVAATPEPSSIALLGTGLLGVAGLLRRRFVNQ